MGYEVRPLEGLEIKVGPAEVSRACATSLR